MNKESWLFNLKISLIEIKIWKRHYITKQLEKNPNITREELSKKIKKAKIKKYRDAHDYVILEHPDNQILKQF